MNTSRRNLVFGGLATISCGAFYKTSDTTVEAKTVNTKNNETFFKLYPVGKVKTQSVSQSKINVVQEKPKKKRK